MRSVTVRTGQHAHQATMMMRCPLGVAAGRLPVVMQHQAKPRMTVRKLHLMLSIERRHRRRQERQTLQLPGEMHEQQQQSAQAREDAGPVHVRVALVISVSGEGSGAQGVAGRVPLKNTV